MKKLGEHLYVYQDTCQVYIIKNNDRAVLVDFGSGDVLDALEGIGVAKVTDVLVTHHHRDQIQGLKKATDLGIAVWVPHQEQELISNADELWQRREIYNNYNNRQDRFSLLHSVSITGTLKDYDTVKRNGIEFTILPTPGHTTGSISIAATIDSQKICFTGDLIYPGGKLWSLAATQWTYNGGEGLPHHVLSLLALKEQNFDKLLPSHGDILDSKETVLESIDLLVERLSRLMKLRRQNPRLFLLRDNPYEHITEHVLFNRTSMANSYVLISKSGKALFFDFGYDFMAGPAAGSDRSSRRPWLYTIPKLFTDYGVTKIDACIPTHYHDDHVAGFNLLKKVYHTRILCPENFADLLNSPENYDLPCLWYDPIPVDEALGLGQKITWEEYELILHPLSGHTRYAVAIEFMADGKKILCTGDQYADGDGLFCNYVYKNKFEADDFFNSAQLYQRIQPDILLSGHWQSLNYKDTYARELEALGKEVSELHKSLLPLGEDTVLTDDFFATFHPYQLQVKEKETFSVKIEITNPFRHRVPVQVQLVLPEGFHSKHDKTSFEKEMGAQENASFTIEITAPKESVHRARIGCDLTLGDIRFGQQAEMLVTVCKQKSK
ncbi:MAG: MBL fold metallo-hydrolase [Lachnospiraceae bacterium]|nr:MBL fold metallo-hydrolase [Lachnospiraceae bacterium]